MEEASWKMHHGRGIMEEASWRRHHGRGIMEGHLEASDGKWRHLRGIQGIWETPGRDLGRHLGDLGSQLAARWLPG
jgi:hypothetical protein